MNDLERLAVYLCPGGRLCECQHPGGAYACPHCDCDCSTPDQFERDMDPDACRCCEQVF
ncbi:hypothetical protein Ade02nite_19980 [Paractinoplanes deccanensis]|uniref:Metallothionein n=1 Tax=Paractinoplanes deccanensis TaxID=113561 RepID=A0ABQ3Y081_9ACTN|nr:hypothetical protein Ade02nite_19980 [Actinoplanes deccanensis]